MLDVGWTELVVIAIVLIIVVGPKDLPPMLRTFGRMMTKMRGMAADFRHQFDEALREADLDEVRKTIDDARSLNPANTLREAMNPLRQMGNEIKADLQRSTRPEAPAAPAVQSGDPPATAPVAAPAPIPPAQPSVPAPQVAPATDAPHPALNGATHEATPLAAAPVGAVASAPILPPAPAVPASLLNTAPVVTVEEIARPKRTPRANTVPLEGEAASPPARKETATRVDALDATAAGMHRGTATAGEHVDAGQAAPDDLGKTGDTA